MTPQREPSAALADSPERDVFPPLKRLRKGECPRADQPSRRINSDRSKRLMEGNSGETPRVSVAITTYNHEHFIERTIASILNQTESSLELIVVDDASQDGTVDRIKRFSDPRLTLIEHEENTGGGGYGMNQAMRQARGQWFAFADGDDWYAPERLERLLGYVGSYDVDMIADNLLYKDQVTPPGDDEQLVDGGNLFSRAMARSLPRIMSAEEFVLGNRPGPRNPSLGLMKPMFRRSFLEKNGLRCYEDEFFNGDTCFFLRCLAAGARMLIVPEIGYNYRRHSASVTGSAEWLYMLGEQAKRNRLLLEEHRDSGQGIISALDARQRAIERAEKFERTRKRLENGELGAVLRSPQDIPSYLSYSVEARAVHLRNRFRGARAKVPGLLNGTRRRGAPTPVVASGD